MDPRASHRRELALLAVMPIGLSRLVDGPLLWLVAGLATATVAVGALQILGEGEPRGLPIETLVLPAVAAAGSVGALRLVPLSYWLLPALAVGGLLVLAGLTLEARLLARPEPTTADDRLAVLGLSLLVGFVAFTGAAALVPGGLAEPSPLGSGLSPAALDGGPLALLAGLDAGVAGLLGFRLTALRHPTLREAFWAAATYALVAGILAAAVRALAIPLLLGPALLTVLLYLWDAWRATPGSVRRSARWIWESALLVLLAVVVVAWNVWLRP